MASIASTSSVFSHDTTTTTETRPQAGPLPSKRGEIGFREDVHGRHMDNGSEEGDNRSIQAMPERHPADRDAHEASAPEANMDVPLTPAALDAAVAESQTAAPTDASSAHSMGKRSIISFLRPKKVPTYGGLRLTTLLLFIFQVSLIGGTIAGWVLATMKIDRSSSQNTSNSQATGGGLGSSSVFIHVVFGIAILGQLLLLERRIFRLRAERYSYIHPGEMLPISRRPSSSTGMGFAPWLRPPLPTYAATLAQSGLGTGDVEDNIIAVPPPPAYGNNRGSRLLLQGFLRESLRAQRPVSVNSQMSQMSQKDERPLSYVAQDEQWQVVEDAERARRLEETLGRLEEGPAGPNRNAGARR